MATEIRPSRTRLKPALPLFQHAGEEREDRLLVQRAQLIAPDPHALRVRGEEHAERGEWDDALTCFNAAAAAGPTRGLDLAVVHELRAQVQLETGDDFAAARAAEDATRLDDTYAAGFHTLGRALRNMGELPLALRHLESALELTRAQGASDIDGSIGDDLDEVEALLVRGFVLACASRAASGSAEAMSVDDAVVECRAHLHATCRGHRG
jgi:tetratricopeptide (TPR) repeat protein